MAGLLGAEKISSKRSIFAYQATSLVLILSSSKAVDPPRIEISLCVYPMRIDVSVEAICRLYTPKRYHKSQVYCSPRELTLT
jgi:hypothetical protein